MNSKTKNIINWVLTALVTIIFLGSGVNKLMGNAEALKMAESFGISAESFKFIGIVEVIATLLFILPRTGVLGSLLLIAFMGGSIATHVEHAQPIMAPVFIAAFLWIVTIIRFPELTKRIIGHKE
jgi:uncharacterized membrane protein YphA (DoxX/SURF4 family)